MLYMHESGHRYAVHAVPTGSSDLAELSLDDRRKKENMEEESPFG